MAFNLPPATTKDVRGLFAGKVFHIPAYQRPYAWTEENWEAFWTDIVDGFRIGTEAHYWGTITLQESVLDPAKDGERQIFDRYDVVDGQQRLTTLFLLFLAMHRGGLSSVRSVYIKKEWRERRDGELGGEEQPRSLYRLVLGDLNNDFLQKLVDGENVPVGSSTSNRRLKDALATFCRKLSQFEEIEALYDYVQAKTYCLEFILPKDRDAIRTFEGLNDRGKPLTLLDKCKSHLMFCSSRFCQRQADEDVRKSFGSIFENYDYIKDFGKQYQINYLAGSKFGEEECLRFFYYYFGFSAISRWKLTEKLAYDFKWGAEQVMENFVKKACAELRHKPEELLTFIKEFTADFERFMSAFRSVLDRTTSTRPLRRLFTIQQVDAVVYPLVIAMEMHRMLDEQTIGLAETVDLLVYKIRPVRGEGPKAGLYSNVICRLRDGMDAIKARREIGQFVAGLMPDSITRTELGGAVYGRAWVKYVLWESEASVEGFDDCDRIAYNNLEVDHTWAQQAPIVLPGAGFADSEEFKQYLPRLGNLCLLARGENRSAQAESPEQKARERYQKDDEPPGTQRLGASITARGEFTKQDIERRTKEITDFVILRWRGGGGGDTSMPLINEPEE